MRDEFTWDSDHYKIPPRRLTPRPVQDPHPPLWIACGGEDSWVEAANAGVGAMSFGFGAPGRLEKCVANYNATIGQAQPASGVINDQKACSTFMFCAKTEKEAYEKGSQCMHLLTNVLGYYLSWEALANPAAGFEDYGRDYLEKVFPGVTSGRPHQEIIAEQAAQGSMMIGTPEQLREQVSAYENLGINQLMFVMQYGKLSHEEILGSMRLFSEEVIAKA